MKDLLTTIAKGLVENPDAVSVEADEVNEDGIVVYHLHVAEEDMGRIIGKQGRIAKAIRVIARSAAIKANTKVMVEIDWYKSLLLSFLSNKKSYQCFICNDRIFCIYGLLISTKCAMDGMLSPCWHDVGDIRAPVAINNTLLNLSATIFFSI